MQESNTWAHFYSSSQAKDGQHVLGGWEGMVEVNALSRATEGVGSGGWGLTGEIVQALVHSPDGPSG